MVAELVSLVGVPVVPALFVAGLLRAYSLDRFQAGVARRVWLAGFAGMAAATLLALAWFAVVGQARAVPEPVYVFGFVLVYLVPVPATMYLVSGWIGEDADPTAWSAVGWAMLVYLALVYPYVNFLNSCVLGRGLLLPAGCN